jgi:hypothetical protein
MDVFGQQEDGTRSELVTLQESQGHAETAEVLRDDEEQAGLLVRCGCQGPERRRLALVGHHRPYARIELSTHRIKSR